MGMPTRYVCLDCLMYTTTISFVPSNLATTGSGVNVASSPSFSMIVSEMDGVSLTMRLLGMKVIMAQLVNAMPSSGYTFSIADLAATAVRRSPQGKGTTSSPYSWEPSYRVGARVGGQSWRRNLIVTAGLGITPRKPRLSLPNFHPHPPNTYQRP